MAEKTHIEHEETPNEARAREAVRLGLAEIRESNPTPLEVLGEERVAELADIAQRTLALDHGALVERATELDKSDEPTAVRAREIAEAHGLPPLSLAYHQAYDAALGGRVKDTEIARRTADRTFRVQLAVREACIDAAEEHLVYEGTTLENAFMPDVQNPPLIVMNEVMNASLSHLDHLQHKERLSADREEWEKFKAESERKDKEHEDAMRQIEDMRATRNTPEAIQRRSRYAYEDGIKLAREQQAEVFKNLEESTQAAAERAILGSVCASREAITQAADMLDSSTDPLLQAAREHDPNGTDLAAYAENQGNQLQGLGLHPADIKRYQSDALYRAVIQRQFRIAYISALRGQQGMTTEEAIQDPGLAQGETFIAAVMVGANYSERPYR